MDVRGTGVKTAPALSFPQAPFFCGPSGVLCRCSGHTDLARGLLRLKWYKRFIRLQRHLAVQGALDARVSLHSRLEARPLRNTAAAYFAPTLRARCFAPSLAFGSGICFSGLSVSGRLVHCLIRCAVSKQRERPQTGNRPGGIFIASLASAEGAECFGLCLNHYC